MTDSVAGMDPRLRMEAAGYSVPGFAERYDAVRFRPPEALLTLLPPILGGGRPGTVVDLGSGTGLSTRFWAESAGEVIGVEPNAAMRTCAERLNRASTVRFVDGSGEQTGLPGATADLVTASQSLHWMAPEPTFAEIGGSSGPAASCVRTSTGASRRPCGSPRTRGPGCERTWRAFAQR